MNARQAAEYRDAIARMRRTAALRRAEEARAAMRAKPKRPYQRRPRSQAAAAERAFVPREVTDAELDLATRILARGGVPLWSTVDRLEQAVIVARMILRERL